MEKTPFIFWLASWYPTRLDPFPGDFIQRHAKALALYYPVHVLHIAKDEKGELTKDVLVEENVDGNLHETTIYYHPRRTGISLIDKIISTRKFLGIGKRFSREIAAKNSNLFTHVHVAMRHGLLAHWARQKLGIKYVITEHWAGYDRNTYPEQLRPGKWFWIATKRIFEQAEYFYPEVKRMGELINKTITPIPYKPVANSVDTSLFYPSKETITADCVFQFVHVSTLSYQKNIEGMLRVIEQYAATNANVHFTFVGPPADDLTRNVRDSQILSKTITLTGALPYHLVAEQMRKADALLMFSRYENQPCVILEALCCGLPVVSTNVGGIAEVINEQNGILIESENESQLLQAITKVIENYSDFNNDDISLNAQQAYSYETIGKQILAYYKADLPQYFNS